MRRAEVLVRLRERRQQRDRCAELRDRFVVPPSHVTQHTNVGDRLRVVWSRAQRSAVSRLRILALAHPKVQVCQFEGRQRSRVAPQYRTIRSKPALRCRQQLERLLCSALNT